MRIPQMVSVSELKNHHLNVIKRLKQGPVLVASHNQPTAIIVSPDEWDSLMDKLESLEALVQAMADDIAILRGEANAEPANLAELKAMAKGEQLPT